MTRDDIIRMAREAGIETVLPAPLGQVESIERFANLVAAAEREACAKVCEEDAFVDQWKGLAEAAKRIRDRGEK